MFVDPDPSLKCCCLSVDADDGADDDVLRVGASFLIFADYFIFLVNISVCQIIIASLPLESSPLSSSSIHSSSFNHSFVDPSLHLHSFIIPSDHYYYYY